MHPASTRSEFIRLRVQGLSLASIGRRLGVSKPTLIAWSRQDQPEIAARILAVEQDVKEQITAPLAQQLADLTRKLRGVKQELFSRAMREIPTPYLETIVGELRQRIEQLESLKSPTATNPNSALRTPHSALQGASGPIRT